MSSSNIFYERTPTLAENADNTLNGQYQPIPRLNCFWASLRSR